MDKRENDLEKENENQQTQILDKNQIESNILLISFKWKQFST